MPCVAGASFACGKILSKRLRQVPATLVFFRHWFPLVRGYRGWFPFRPRHGHGVFLKLVKLHTKRNKLLIIGVMRPFPCTSFVLSTSPKHHPASRIKALSNSPGWICTAKINCQTCYFKQTPKAPKTAHVVMLFAICLTVGAFDAGQGKQRAENKTSF